MPWKLDTDELDEGPASRLFATKAEAMDAAVVWFASAYDPEVNDTLGGKVPWGVAEDTLRLLTELEAGRSFSCPRFAERVTLTETASTAETLRGFTTQVTAASGTYDTAE